jgi:hypothetical protein
MRANLSEEKPPTRSRVAVLGTLAEMHRESIKYDLKMLGRLVKDLQPDLLCAEIRLDDWQTGDLSNLPFIYREGLVPLARRTDIIIVPVEGSKDVQLIAPHGGRWRGLREFIVRLLNGHLRWMQRLANGPETINSPIFQSACQTTCALIARMCGVQTQRAWDQANQDILDNVLTAIRRDPGRRVLVTVDCRRSHRLIQSLRGMPEVELVDYRLL